jgi:hypothetical protein
LGGLSLARSELGRWPTGAFDTPEWRVITSDGYAMIVKLLGESFEKKQPIATGELIGKIDYFFGTPLSLKTVNHILQGMPRMMVFNDIPMDNEF